ncbi:glycosyltransferase [Roseibium sp. SCP14]|uniref:glycosyltransferase n=1 Tax=Roseibium sp. SCP14 TaxID=3141375 RepID=UPI00333DC681
MTDMSPKVLIASLGTRGDVQPYVALARELTARNAEVVLTTGEGFEDMIEAAGARARPVPINYQELLQTAEIREALFSLKGMIKTARQNIDLQKEIARKLWQIGMDEKPDLILFNLKATVMTLVARRLNIPALPTSLQPVTAPTRDFPIALFGVPDLGSYLNRKSYGLGRLLMRAGLRPLVKSLRDEAVAEINQPEEQIDGHMPDGSKALSLQAFSSALVPTPEDWPPEYLPCGYWFTDPDPDYRPPDALEAFLQSGPAPTYLGFGSMPSKNPQKLTDTVLAALSQTGQRAILATGWGGLLREKLPTELADRVLLLDKAPHSWLFPRCAAIVHHGGAGTTHEAIRWGKPSLVCPVFADQPFWGDRIHRIGAGPAAIKQKKLTADNLAKALNDLENSDYKSGAERAAGIIAKELGAKGTAGRLLDQFTTVPA